MAKKLRNLEISKVDVVDRGANQRAHMKLLKRDGTRSGAWTLIEKCVPGILKVLRENGVEQTEEAGLTEADRDAIAQIAERAGIDAVAEYVKALADEMRDEGAGGEEDVNAEDMELAKRYSWLGKEPRALAEALKKARGAGEREYAALVSGLEEELGIVNGLFAEIGKRGDAKAMAADPWARIDKAASDLAREKPSISKAAAIDEICQAHPDWVREYEQNRMEGR